MFERLRELLKTTAGKITAGVLLGLTLIWLYFSIRNNVGESAFAAESRQRTFICVETGKTFNHTIASGETFPVQSPYSGRATGYQAEKCFWTKEGKPKDSPTYVLLNAYKGLKGPTFCPDCGRQVVSFNPPAREDTPPPPLKSEYEARKHRSTRGAAPDRDEPDDQ